MVICNIKMWNMKPSICDSHTVIYNGGYSESSLLNKWPCLQLILIVGTVQAHTYILMLHGQSH